MPDRDPTQRDLIDGLSRIPLRMPRSMRELLHLLSLHPPGQDIAVTLARVDVRGVTPSDVYRLVHGRAPGEVDEAIAGHEYDARRHLRDALLSAEFRATCLRRLLSAFAGLRREVFIHVPKCAGTDLILNVAPQRLGIAHMLTQPGWLSPAELLVAIGDLVRAAPLYDEIFVYGHIEFGEYVDTCGVRPGDRFFTIVRDPFELLLSQANYAVSRLCQDPQGHDPDTRETLDWLGLPHLDDSTPASLKALAARCLLDRRISQPNRMTFFLAREQPSTYAMTVRTLVPYDFEITTAARYSRWLRERWGIASQTQHNKTTAFLSRREARLLFAERLAPSIAEDQKLYDVVTWALDASGGASVTGLEIARAAGAELMEALPARLAAGRPPPAEPLLAAQSAELVALYLESIPNDLVPSDRRLNDVVIIKLAADGNSAAFKRNGWWLAEESWTWTAGAQARLCLDRPAVAGTHLLRVIAEPFIADGRVAAQRISISVNGVQVGAAQAHDVAVFDCELDWSLLAASDTVDIVLDLPDAAPASTAPDGDHRIVAFAVREVRLLRVGEAGTAPVAASVAEPAMPAPPETLAELLTGFESLGENCEFGLVQRRCGAEPLGLLRFSSTPLPPLLRALRARFVGMGRPEFIEVELAESGSEYMIFDKRFQFRYHAWVNVGEQDPDDIHARETRRLPFLIRKLIDDLTDGHKIFVYHGIAPLDEAQARELHAAIGDYGPGKLLWVECADAAHAPGSVVEIAPGLLKGHIDRFAPANDAHDLSLDGWIALCREAARMAGVNRA